MTLNEDFNSYILDNNVSFAVEDFVTIEAAYKMGASFSPDEITLLSDLGVDVIDSGAAPSRSNIGAVHAEALAASKISFDDNDAVRIYDDGSDISALSPELLSKLRTKRVDEIDAWDDQLTLSLDQYKAINAT